MVDVGRGRLFRRKDGKFLIYLPKDLAEDSMFPFKDAPSVLVKVSFKLARRQTPHREMEGTAHGRIN